MTIIDEQTNQLIQQKHELMREYEKAVIDKETYDLRIKEINNKINERTQIIMNNNSFKIEKKEQEVKSEMVEEIVKEKGKKPQKDSYTMIIVNALMLKSIKNIEAAVERVLEIKPGRDKKKVESHIKTIIYLVKQQKPKRWQKYSWDEENFLLTSIC